MFSNYHYNKDLKLIARKLRNEPTKGEQILWYSILQQSKMRGFKFHRQRSILNYIADFFCKELKLIIEVDGYTHDNKVSQDNMRDRRLQEKGYHVLRIPDRDVFKNIENVIRQIDNTIDKILTEGKSKNGLTSLF